MTQDHLENLKCTSELDKEIKEIVLNNIQDYEEPMNFFNDLASHGCVSGMISELVWFSDTVSFCKRHKEETNERISELIDCYGVMSLAELLGDRFDKTDFLCLGDSNQNLITWFIFEEACDSIVRDYENKEEFGAVA
jgi:hypothetical protein